MIHAQNGQLVAELCNNGNVKYWAVWIHSFSSFNPKTSIPNQRMSSLHWNSNVRDVWGQCKNMFLYCGDVLGKGQEASLLCFGGQCPSSGP